MGLCFVTLSILILIKIILNQVIATLRRKLDVEEIKKDLYIIIAYELN